MGWTGQMLSVAVEHWAAENATEDTILKMARLQEIQDTPFKSLKCNNIPMTWWHLQVVLPFKPECSVSLPSLIASSDIINFNKIRISLKFKYVKTVVYLLSKCWASPAGDWLHVVNIWLLRREHKTHD